MQLLLVSQPRARPFWSWDRSCQLELFLVPHPSLVLLTVFMLIDVLISSKSPQNSFLLVLLSVVLGRSITTRMSRTYRWKLQQLDDYHSIEWQWLSRLQQPQTLNTLKILSEQLSKANSARHKAQETASMHRHFGHPQKGLCSARVATTKHQIHDSIDIAGA